MIELQGKFGKDCKIFTNAIENEAIGTIQNILNNPVTTGVPVRIMPDTHQGVDIVIGFTMPVTDRVNPNHIGVDIGCGMLCVEIENAITEESFPDINHAIRSIIPMGFEINQQPLSKQEKEDLFTFLSIRMDQFCSKYQLTKPVINEEYVSQLCKKVGMTVHNYISFDDMIIRKGAIAAYANDYVVIPMNMADGILLCRGKGNKDWNYSAPHGAGRLYSRSEAKERLSMDAFKTQMSKVYSTSVCEGTLDESPMAYKNVQEIKELIEPTVEIIDTIVPLINIKAV